MKERLALSQATLDRILTVLASAFDFDDNLPDPERYNETKCTIFRLSNGQDNGAPNRAQGPVMEPVSFIKERLVILGKTLTVWRELNCS